MGNRKTLESEGNGKVAVSSFFSQFPVLEVSDGGAKAVSAASCLKLLCAIS